MLKDLGQVSEFVGIERQYDENWQKVHLNPTCAIRRPLKKFGLENCKTISIPMECNTVAFLHSESNLAGKVPSHEAICTLMSLATCTRRDISYTAGTLAQYFENPYTVHWTMGKSVFRSLKSTDLTGLSYKMIWNDAKRQFQGYTDWD